MIYKCICGTVIKNPNIKDEKFVNCPICNRKINLKIREIRKERK